MSKIEILKKGITEFDTDAIVNAANSGLYEGSGVCGAIFRAAGSRELNEACRRIGGCETGNAVITPGFRLKAGYVIHAVGPIYHGGNHGEGKLLYNAYKNSLLLAMENNLHSITFPVISSGIYGYPKKEAWEKGISACRKFHELYPDYEMDIYFAVLDDEALKLGNSVLKEMK